jgi:hypothetical protein
LIFRHWVGQQWQVKNSFFAPKSGLNAVTPPNGSAIGP